MGCRLGTVVLRSPGSLGARREELDALPPHSAPTSAAHLEGSNRVRRAGPKQRGPALRHVWRRFGRVADGSAQNGTARRTGAPRLSAVCKSLAG